MLLLLIQALVGPEEEALEHNLHGALVQRVVLPLLLGMQPLLLADPQQQVSLPQSACPPFHLDPLRSHSKVSPTSTRRLTRAPCLFSPR